MYEYLLADLIGLLIWFILFAILPRFRKVMVWSSLVSSGLILGVAIVWKFASFFVQTTTFYPAYWNPQVLFDLGKIFPVTIEDVLFFFIMGGFVGIIYDLFSKKIVRDHRTHHPHIGGIVIAVVISLALFLWSNFNPMYSFIIAQTIAAAYMLIRRPDLMKHTILSGFLFGMFYVVFFWGVLLLWPEFAANWSLQNLAGLVLGIPLEEILWSISHGFFFGPLYEYVRHAHDIQEK